MRKYPQALERGDQFRWGPRVVIVLSTKRYKRIKYYAWTVSVMERDNWTKHDLGYEVWETVEMVR